MPYAMVPPGYRAVLLGQAANLADLGTLAPLEESTAEGALVLVRLDFADFPTGEMLTELEKKLRDAGVHTWPGCPLTGKERQYYYRHAKKAQKPLV